MLLKAKGALRANDLPYTSLRDDASSTTFLSVYACEKEKSPGPEPGAKTQVLEVIRSAFEREFA
jgi:hypothetical protein